MRAIAFALLALVWVYRGGSSENSMKKLREMTNFQLLVFTLPAWALFLAALYCAIKGL